jgi:hypothetical protein
MIHFVYKTINPVNGKYYIGKHSTLDLNDGYTGSGLWIKDCLKSNTKLETTIIKVCKSEKQAYKQEEKIIKEHFNNSLNMNFKYGGSGLSKNDFEIFKKISMTLKGRKNPEHSKRMTGEGNPNYGIKKDKSFSKLMSKVHSGKSINEEHKQKNRLAQLGKIRSNERKKNQSEAVKLWWANRKKNKK